MTDSLTPTTAHQAQLVLYHRVLLEVSRRRQDDLPGLIETLQDGVLVSTGGTSRKALGWFAESVWCERSTSEPDSGRRFHEVYINADRRHVHPWLSPAEDLFVTLLHEGCHAWAAANGIQDTSRQGRWRNRRFAEIARKIGLVAEPDSRIGHTTSCLSPWARAAYADLLAGLDAGLVLTREPKRTHQKPGTSQPSRAGQSKAATPPAQYVFASCRCQTSNGRFVTIWAALGSWQLGVIRCDLCQSPFTQS